MATALEYLVLGHEQDEQGDASRKLLRFNGALPSLDPAFYIRIIDMAPMTDETGAGQPSLALVEYDGPQLLLVAAQPADQAGAFNDHFVFIPVTAVAESALQFEDWLTLLPEATGDVNVTLPSLPPPDFNPNDSQTRARHLQYACIESCIRLMAFESLLSLLGAVIDPRQLLIKDSRRFFASVWRSSPRFRRCCRAGWRLASPSQATRRSHAKAIPISCS